MMIEMDFSDAYIIRQTDENRGSRLRIRQWMGDGNIYRPLFESPIARIHNSHYTQMPGFQNWLEMSTTMSMTGLLSGRHRHDKVYLWVVSKNQIPDAFTKRFEVLTHTQEK